MTFQKRVIERGGGGGKHFNGAEISRGEAVRNVQEKPRVRGLLGQDQAVGTK